ncbi:transporter [Nocardioides stalactiti]|uniref:transporter n=1 Tax=Nocardioides stalactiti TaxID=2755356 RepID=UPI0015FFF676|nr:transporter [Nocardioides stalactiti]
MMELLFLIADLWMIYAGFTCGWKFIRHYGNYLLGLEWMVVGTSGTNFLLWSLLGGDEDSPLYWLAYYFDAFSRSVGVTLIVVLGLLRVTHRYHPSRTVDVGAFVLAAIAGLYLQQFHHGFHAGPATFYVVVALLTSVFVFWFANRLRQIGAHGHAIATALVTAAGLAIAITYDFFPIPGDDEYRTIFYTLALATWGTQLFVLFRAYGALHQHNVASGVESAVNRRADART